MQNGIKIKFDGIINSLTVSITSNVFSSVHVFIMSIYIATPSTDNVTPDVKCCSPDMYYHSPLICKNVSWHNTNSHYVLCNLLQIICIQITIIIRCCSYNICSYRITSSLCIRCNIYGRCCCYRRYCNFTTYKTCKK